MPYDFAKRNKSNKKRSRRSDTPAWMWLLTGIATGLFAAFLLFLSKQPTGNNDTKPDVKQWLQEVQSTLVEENKAEETKDNNAEKIKTGPRFEFYQALPNIELKSSTNSINKNTTKKEKKKNYVLQAGSFKSKQDADRLRAELILLGLNTKITKIKDDHGQKWHRVITGPYEGSRAINQAMDILSQNETEYLLMEASDN